MKEETTLKRHVKLGFSHIDTLEIVSTLNILLANYQVHYQKLRNFHWNVQGGDFFELHEKFEEIYTRINDNIDVIAERIRVFDKVPFSTFNEYLEHSSIQEPVYGYSSYEMVRSTIEDFEVLLSLQHNVMNAANTIGDSGTIDIVNSHIQEMEKDFWMFSSWLKNA